MKLSKKILFAQEGAQMPAPEAAPQGGAPEQAPQPNPQDQLQQVAGQLVEMLMQQVVDPQAVMAILQMASEMVAQKAQLTPPTYQKQGGRLIQVRH